MKDNIDIMAGLISMLGALMRALKKKLGKREIVINLVVAFALSFGVVAGLCWWLPSKVHDTRLIVFITFFIGWISNDFTDTFEKLISDIYDIGIEWLKTKLKKK
jgi:hypothetical protein